LPPRIKKTTQKSLRDKKNQIASFDQQRNREVDFVRACGGEGKDGIWITPKVCGDRASKKPGGIGRARLARAGEDKTALQKEQNSTQDSPSKKKAFG